MQIIRLKVRGIEFGTGIPKICVPIVAAQKEDILFQAKQILKEQPECVELRIDWFDEVSDIDKVLELLKELRHILKDIVLLFTFRTKREGGRRSISARDYTNLCERVCQSGNIDLIDVEAYMQDCLLYGICETAHRNGVYVVGSNHDFYTTSEDKEIAKRLLFMDKNGADIPKIAVTPEGPRDVLSLLSAGLLYYENGGRKPIITMSMGGQGAISRLVGETFGSALTFATAGHISAPGQLPIDKVRSILKDLHEFQ